MKIGFVVKDLSPSQLSYNIITKLNAELEQSCTDDYCVFIQEPSGKMKPNNFSIINSTEMWTFDGILIATDIPTAKQISKTVGPSKKYFYVWDLYWSRPEWRDYESSILAFIDPTVKLLARSEDHAKAISNYCNRDVCGIVDDFNIQQIRKLA